MPRLAVLRLLQAEFRPSDLIDHVQHNIASVKMPTVIPPRQNEFSSVAREEFKCFIVFRPDGVSSDRHFLGIGFPIREDVGHHEPAVAPGLREVDAASHGRIVVVLIGRRRIKAAEHAHSSKFAIFPPTPE